MKKGPFSSDDHIIYTIVFKMSQRRAVVTVTKAVSVITCYRSFGDFTSLVLNPHDCCFYGCNTTSKAFVKIEGIYFFFTIFLFLLLMIVKHFNIIYLIEAKCVQFVKFEDNLVPKGIDYYVNGRYFIIVLNGPTPAIYKKLASGIQFFHHLFVSSI